MKVLQCRDVGINCDYKAKGRTVDEVIKRATEHAKKDHHVDKVTKDYVDAWRKKIHDE